MERLWKELHTEEHRPALSEKTEQDLILEWPAIIFGMNTGDGNPGAKTVAALYTMGADGSLNMSASASLINGTISSPQEGGKDGFISALSSAGMSGSWVSESADMLAGMDLANNPVQDMAGVPNPL